MRVLDLLQPLELIITLLSGKSMCMILKPSFIYQLAVCTAEICKANCQLGSPTLGIAMESTSQCSFLFKILDKLKTTYIINQQHSSINQTLTTCEKSVLTDRRVSNQALIKHLPVKLLTFVNLDVVPIWSFDFLSMIV